MTSILRASILLCVFALAGNALAASVTVVSGSGQTARSGTYYAQPVVLQVRDAGGAPLPGVTVQLARLGIDDGRWMFSFDPPRVSDSRGIVSFDRLIATGPAGGLSMGVNVVLSFLAAQQFSDVFQMQITGAQPARIELLSGASQSAYINEPFAQPLVARVIDELGAPVPNAVVRFDLLDDSMFPEAPPGTPRGNFLEGNPFAITLIAADDRGIAVSPRFSANAYGGAWTMQASAFYAPVRFGGAQASTPMLNQMLPPPSPGVLAATRASIDSDGVTPLDVGARILTAAGLPMSGQTVQFRLGVGAEPATLTQAAVITDSQGYAYTRVYPRGALAGYFVQASWVGQLATIKVNRVETETSVSVQDLWWAGPGENGWGVSIAQSGNDLFAGIYGYDASGSPLWHVMSSGNWNSARTVFSGLLYAPKGSPFFAYDASRLQVGGPVGVATFTFTGRDTAELELTVDGVTTRKSISRQLFGTGVATGPPVGGMWWGGPAQSGWGVSIAQQDAELFSVWYTYDASGIRTWYVLPGGDWTSPTSYEGRVFKTSGSLLAAYDPARFRVSDVGSYRLRFEGEVATLEYTVEGRSGTLSLTRQPF